MKDRQERRDFTMHGHTLTAGETELYVEETFFGVSGGIPLEVKDLHERDGETYATVLFAEGAGPELDVPAAIVCRAIGGKLSWGQST